MPAYDYRCTRCSEAFELVHAMGADVDPVCPSCGGQGKRIFSSVGVAFKGSGFHNTDYRPKPAESCPSAGSAPS